MAPQQNEYTTFESHGGLEVDKPSSSLNLKAKVLALGFLLATVGAFVGLSGGFSSAKTSLTESANIEATPGCDDENVCCDGVTLYGGRGVGSCAILRGKSQNQIKKICENDDPKDWDTARDICTYSCDAYAHGCPKVCVCPGGIPLTGDACEYDGTYCAECDEGSFKNTNNLCIEHMECEDWQHQTRAPSGTEDRECADNVCSCSNGVAVTGQECTDDDAEECTECSGDYHLSGHVCEAFTVCGDNQWMTKEGSPTEDRECADKTCICENGNEADAGTADCHTDGADICKDCSGEYFLTNEKTCQAWTLCAATTRESQEPSNTQDRQCEGQECGASGCCDDDSETYGEEGDGNCATLRGLPNQAQEDICSVVDDDRKTANDICRYTCDSCPADCDGAFLLQCNRIDTCTWTTGARGCSDGNKGKCASCVDCEETRCGTYDDCEWAWVRGSCSQDQDEVSR